MKQERIIRIDSAWAQKLFKLAGDATRLPDGWPEPRGWQLNSIDPMELLRVFPTLNLESGYVLRSYIFGSDNSEGDVWAFPEGTEQPTPVRDYVPGEPPDGVFADVRPLIRGDGTPESYFSASLFYRELMEIGASWHGVKWHAHTLITSDPWKRPQRNNGDEIYDWPRPESKSEPWEWSMPRPDNWQPSVLYQDKRIVVCYYSYSGCGGQYLYCHRDTYPLDSYNLSQDDAPLACGGGGYIF